MSYRVPSKEALLMRAAERASSNLMFMGAILRADRNGEFDLAEIAAFLGTDQLSVVSLALFQRPRTSSALFANDVRAIAATSGISAEAIATIVRRVDAVSAIRRAKGAAFMAAAQDDLGPRQIPPSGEST
jgi:hypothetical protein